MRTIRLICWLILLTGALVYRVDVAAAQGSAAAQQACTPDAMRLCSEFVPDVAKVTACMHAKRAQLSGPCRAVMAAGGRRAHEVRREREVRHHYRRHWHCSRHDRHCR